ncbi:uncharacterized protein LOC111088084 [Limulus polyphemus]|uniref:Uncharacterized protein LOC111088084 n=1 Tax=Limulus polyphemus TaxID=6850 RepID=A0ABM1TA09_LIMPO|nr:uncharacterized protein LOC111088084 [Limulus polyphemus]
MLHDCTVMSENLYKKQKALGVLPKTDSEDDESRFRLLRENMLKLLHTSDPEKSDSTDDDSTVKSLPGKGGTRKKQFEKRKNMSAKSVANRGKISVGKKLLKKEKKQPESLTSNRVKSNVKTPCTTDPIMRSKSLTTSKSEMRKRPTENERVAVCDRSYKIKHTTRRADRKFCLSEETPCDVETMVSKVAKAESESTKGEFPVSFNSLSTILHSPDLRRPSSPWQLNCSTKTKLTTKSCIQRSKKRATSVESGHTNQTKVVNSVLRKMESADSVPRLRNSKSKTGALFRTAKDFGGYRQDSQTSSGSNFSTSSSNRSLRNIQSRSFVSSHGHQDRFKQKVQRQPPESSIRLTDFKSGSIETSKLKKNKNGSSTSSSKLINKTSYSLPPIFSQSDCETSWMTSVLIHEPSTDLPSGDQNEDEKVEKKQNANFKNIEAEYDQCENKLETEEEKFHDNCKTSSRNPTVIVTSSQVDTNQQKSKWDNLGSPEPSNENEDIMSSLLPDLSNHAKECWAVHQKLRQEGLQIPLSTLQRGLLTPTELRELQQTREIHTT